MDSDNGAGAGDNQNSKSKSKLTSSVHYKSKKSLKDEEAGMTSYNNVMQSLTTMNHLQQSLGSQKFKNNAELNAQAQ